MTKTLLAFIFAVTIQASTYAQVYKTIDSDGKVKYSDVPTKNSEEIKLNELNVTDSADLKYQSWGALRRNSTKMSFHFSVIPTNDAFELISAYALKNDGIILKYNINYLSNIKVKQINIPWAQVVQSISDEYKLELNYSNGIVIVSDKSYIR